MAKLALTPEIIALVAERFKALAEPARLQILHSLLRHELTVGELVEETGYSHANVSKHLQLLHAHRFVARRKEGLHVRYRLGDRSIVRLCDIMCDRLAAELKARQKALAS